MRSPRPSRSSPSGPAGTRIANLYRRSITREFGDLAFQPVDGPGDYYLYYLPYRGSITSNYPRIFYPAPTVTADAAWQASTVAHWTTLPRANVVAMESIDDFNSFSPMQVIATQAETQALVRKAGNAPFILFAEDRAHPGTHAERPAPEMDREWRWRRRHR